MGRLRNEDYVVFLDESIHEGPRGFTVVAGLLIPARILRSAERRDSVLSPFVQMADLVAGAARLSVLDSPFAKGWYREELVEHAARMGRAIDVSRHARSQLRERSRQDACGSGWKDSLLVP